MIKPTIGRMVHFYHCKRYPHVTAHGPVFAAIITHVWSDNCINIAAFDSNGVVFGETSVELLQDDSPKPLHQHCCWMPYQKAVAAGEIPPTLHAT